MISQKRTIHSLEELDALAHEFVASSKVPRVCAFHGEMGAGKTTFIAALCRHLNTEGDVSSPTFSLVNEYVVSGRKEKVYHFDFYRLEHAEEALDFGVEEYFDSGHWCFLEWAERIEDYLPQDCLHVKIQLDDDKRIISW